MKTIQKLSVLLLALALTLSACNMPSSSPTQAVPEAAFTLAAQTVEAQLTQSALLNPPTNTPLPMLPTNTLPPILPTNTPVPPTLTPTPLCDLGQFIQDVSIPDGTQFLPGQTYTKTWRLRNIGTCTWTSGYQIIFDSGDVMGGATPQALAGTVAAGQTVDISVNLTAPATPGTYRGYWRLRNQAGVLVPIASGFQGQSFFVEIKVVAPTATATATFTQGPTATATATVTPTNTTAP